MKLEKSPPAVGPVPGDLIKYRSDLNLSPEHSGFLGVLLRDLAYGNLSLVLWQDGRQSIEMTGILEAL